MSELTIPAGFNDWPRQDQIQHYLAAAWRLQPVYGPKAQGVDSPGKRPRLTLEQRLALTNEDLRKWFNNGTTDNLGQIPDKPHVVVDLDDKSAGRSLEAFFVIYPELGNLPRVRTNRGAHLHIFCPDVPSGVKKCVSENLLPGLNAEFFADPAGNVVLPPSVHPSGFIYRWEGEGVIPVISWVKLVEIFKFAERPAERPQGSGAWKRAYQGDLRTLDLVALCRHLGIYGELLNADEDKHSVRCPWAAEHTGGGADWYPTDSSTVIFTLPDKLPSFRCLHAHCQDRALRDLLGSVKDNRTVDRFCRSAYDSLGKKKGVFEDGEEETRCPYPPVDWSEISKTAGSGGPEFVHQAIYPEDSILAEYMEAGRSITEGADCYLLGAILPVVGALLKRRLYISFGAGPKYPNIFSILVGRPGDRKSSTIGLAARIARRILPLEAFLPMNVSPEGLFEQYYPGSGGLPDKLWICDDANAVVGDWVSSSVGARTATRFLRLYDCQEFDEAFVRNKKSNEGKTGRSVEETSTSVLFGSTFTVCSFQGTQIQSGLARRFLYYLADGHGRLIVRPRKYELGPLADTFAPLSRLSGEVDFAPTALLLWEAYQRNNRRQIAETNRFDDALNARLSTEPDHVLKIAMIFEAARAVNYNRQRIAGISAESLELAIAHVRQNMQASAFLGRIAVRQATNEQAEIILSVVRKEFRSWGTTIYATRTDLTQKFCHNTKRRGALTVSDLYDNILPHLQAQGECVRVLKRKKLEVYAFPVERDADEEEGIGPEDNSPNSPFSPGGHTHEEQKDKSSNSTSSPGGHSYEPTSNNRGIEENGENKNDVRLREDTAYVCGTGEDVENKENTPETTGISSICVNV
jgi:hypothetical protein